jgi:2,4-dienoyl-CoA reductase-like NADH-dependent reductase (Old Yellow Enzyme family)
MYVMRGEMPIYSMTYYMKQLWLKYGVRMVGSLMIPKEPYKDLYFLDDARLFRSELTLPLIYVGGAVSREGIDKVLDDEGFDFVQMGRALLAEPDFVNKLRDCENAKSCCEHVNYCIARMYSREMACHKNCKDLPKRIVKEIEEIKRKNG